MTWVPIVNRSFTRAQIGPYIAALQFGAWRGKFAVLHNTSAPTLAQWHEPSPADPAHRMQNLVHFYRDEQLWHAGPHFYVADDLIWAFTPADMPGVHSPSWNSESWGVELVGEYDVEPFNDAVRDNGVALIAALYHRFGLGAGTLKFHHDDPATTHKNCPGKHVSKPDMISRIAIRLAQMTAEGKSK